MSGCGGMADTIEPAGHCVPAVLVTSSYARVDQANGAAPLASLGERSPKNSLSRCRFDPDGGRAHLREARQRRARGVPAAGPLCPDGE